MATRSLPPRTPKKYTGKTSRARTEPKPKDTPRSLPSLAPIIEARKLRVEIGDLMNSETLVCTPDEFMDCYMPPRDKQTTQQVLELLLDAGILVPRDPNLPTTTESTRGAYRYVFKVFQQKPSEVKKGAKKRPQGDDGEISQITVNEILMYNNLGDVGEAILNALKNVEGVNTNGYQIRMCPHKPVTSVIDGDGHCIDAALTKNLDKKIPLLVTDIIVPFEFKLYLVNEESNRQQLVCHVNHTMNDDPRRLWVYGMTIEDDQVTIWYFSRSHSMMSTSFSFLDRADLLVEILVSFFCATDEQLGIDPNVKLVGKDKYVYRFPSDATNPEPAYYYTVDSIEEYRPLRLRCRATRLWKVVEVESFEKLDPISDTEMVIKEVCLNTDTPSEVDIQEQLFVDIEQFRDDKQWRNREILADFSAASKKTLGTALKDFKKYFSCAVRQHRVEAGCKVSPNAWTIPNIFPVYTPPKAQSLGTTVRHMSGTEPVLKETVTLRRSTRNKPATEKDSEGLPGPKVLTPRHICRVLFENVCTPLHDITTLGEAMDVLKQCVIALQIMFCAGWVHRDISSGNILALRAKRGAKWQVKLSDLEYAKRFPSQDPASAIPKTATPHFMPCEILKQEYLQRFEYGRQSGHIDQESGSNACVVHAYQHDLESIWWLILWLITMRILGDLPRPFDSTIFNNNPVGNDRKDFLQRKLLNRNDVVKALPENLKGSPFLSAVDNLRQNLLSEYIKRNEGERHYNLASYSWIIGEGIKQFFTEISDTRRKWGGLQMMQKLEKQDVRKSPSNMVSPPPSPTGASKIRTGEPGPSKKPRLLPFDKVKKMKKLL